MVVFLPEITIYMCSLEFVQCQVGATCIIVHYSVALQRAKPTSNVREMVLSQTVACF